MEEVLTAKRITASVLSNQFLIKSTGMLVKVLEGVIKDNMAVVGDELLQRLVKVQHARKWGKHKHLLQCVKIRLRYVVSKLLLARFKCWKSIEKPERPLDLSKSSLNQY